MKTGDPVDDKDVHGKYEKAIMSHAGVRFFRAVIGTRPFLSNAVQSNAGSA